MAKISLVLDTHVEDKLGKHPVIVKISRTGEWRRIKTSYRMTEEEWYNVQNQAKYVPKSKWDAATDGIMALEGLYTSALKRLSVFNNVDAMPIADLRDRLEEDVTGIARSGKVRRKNRFLEHYRSFMETRETAGTRGIYLRTLKKILEFDTKAESLSFDSITKDWLTAFDIFLRGTTSANIRNLHFRNIRAVFNDAIDSDITTAYPFRKFRLPKLEQTRKRALSVEQLRQLRDYPCDDWQAEYRDMFMLMVYLIGINAVDLFTAKSSDIVDGRLEYRRDKTHKLYSIKIEPEAQEIIDRYRGKNWLLSPLDRYANYKDYLQHMNRALQKIGTTFVNGCKPTGQPLFPDITSYWARHSWATVASHLDISMEIIGRALGHSWVSNTVTSIYIDFDNRKVDEANRKVLDLIGES